MLIPYATTAMLAVFLLRLVHERLAVDAALRRVPLRICVTGTRGKSSVTRLIGAGLRAGGLATLTKVTGTSPAIVSPGGLESPIKRRGQASILEQVRLLRSAARMRAEALVFEVMSVRPETQSVETGSILVPTHLAITNARLDHLGGGVTCKADVARMLALSVPFGGTVHMPAEEIQPEILEACAARGARLTAVGPLNPGIDPGELAYPEFEANLRLALSVCTSMGIPPAIAFAGMRKSVPDPGALRFSQMDGSLFVSAFAANDPESTLEILDKIEARNGPFARRVWILAIRADRGERSLQWIETLAGFTRKGIALDEVLVVGDSAHGRAAAKALRRAGVNACFFPAVDPDAISLRARSPGGVKGLVFGVGNIAGVGRALAERWALCGECP